MGRPQIFDEDKVLVKALHVFWQKGFSGTSTRDLTEAIGISNGSLFNSFGDKRNLYLKCLEKYDTIYISALDDLLKAEMPFKEKIKSVLLAATKKLADDESYEGCFYFNTAIDNGVDDPTVLDVANRISDRITNAFLFAVEMAKSDSEISHSVASAPFAQYLFNVLNGLRVMLLNHPTQTTIESVINITLELLPA